MAYSTAVLWVAVTVSQWVDWRAAGRALQMVGARAGTMAMRSVVVMAESWVGASALSKAAGRAEMTVVYLGY